MMFFFFPTDFPLGQLSLFSCLAGDTYRSAAAAVAGLDAAVTPDLKSAVKKKKRKKSGAK
jgi:hypothetical protein